jgi:uncharacterized oxidoreductase
MSPVVLSEEQLRRFVDGVCRAIGAPAEVAAEVACHLVRANLSGHDALGVARLRDYVAEADAGTLVPSALPTVLRETPATALIDAARGFGHHSTAFALAWCLERAASSGLAAAAVRHSSHVGRIGEYAERAAEAGMLAIVTVGAAGPGVGDVMLFGGRDRFFGANPWSFGAPGRSRSLAFDGPTSTVGEHEVRLAAAKREALPPDCVYDRYGRPSTDPDELFAGGGLVPLGGAVAGWRGAGLAFASALLGGLAMIGDEAPSLVGTPATRQDAGVPGRVAGVFVQVVDPAAFGDPGAYRDMVDGVLEAAHSARPGGGRSEVVLPGEPEARARGRAERGGPGVRLAEATWADLGALAERFGVPAPERD